MTSKELLYVEDALGHEQYFQTKCNEVLTNIQDTELKSAVQGMATKHQQIFNSFLNLLQEENNAGQKFNAGYFDAGKGRV